MVIQNMQILSWFQIRWNVLKICFRKRYRQNYENFEILEFCIYRNQSKILHMLKTYSNILQKVKTPFFANIYQSQFESPIVYTENTSAGQASWLIGRPADSDSISDQWSKVQKIVIFIKNFRKDLNQNIKNRQKIVIFREKKRI